MVKARAVRGRRYRNAMVGKLSELGLVMKGTLMWILVGIWRALRLNPVSVMRNRMRNMYRMEDGTELPVKPKWTEYIKDLFISDVSRRLRLLQWVRSRVKHVTVDDFIYSWHDGIALCALLESVCPGVCPRFYLLRTDLRVNNCRFGLGIAHKYLGIQQTILTPGDMAIADESTEMKIVHLVQMIRWKHQRTPHMANDVTMPVRRTMSRCFARGTGLKTGMVGRKAKFIVFTECNGYLDVLIEIHGPDGEMHSERITSIHADASTPKTISPEAQTHVITDNQGNSFVRQKSYDDESNLPIPFDYESQGDGRFLVSYVPRNPGDHAIKIRSHDHHIQGSPFHVTVSSWTSTWSSIGKSRLMSLTTLPSIEEGSNQKPQLANVVSNRFLEAVSERASRRKGKQPRQLTVAKRRVVKKLITRNGEEVVLSDYTPSPSLSRQSSVDTSDLSEEEHTRKTTVGKTVDKRANTGRNSNLTNGSSKPLEIESEKSDWSTSDTDKSNLVSNGNKRHVWMTTEEPKMHNEANRRPLVDDIFIPSADNSCDTSDNLSAWSSDSFYRQNSSRDSFASIRSKADSLSSSLDLDDKHSGTPKVRIQRSLSDSCVTPAVSATKTKVPLKVLTSGSTRKNCYYISGMHFEDSAGIKPSRATPRLGQLKSRWGRKWQSVDASSLEQASQSERQHLFGLRHGRPQETAETDVFSETPNPISSSFNVLTNPIAQNINPRGDPIQRFVHANVNVSDSFGHTVSPYVPTKMKPKNSGNPMSKCKTDVGSSEYGLDQNMSSLNISKQNFHNGHVRFSESTNRDGSSTDIPKIPSKIDEGGMSFRTIEQNRSLPSSPIKARLDILIPKVKTDKSTQVKSEEISKETGWPPIGCHIKERLKYINLVDKHVWDNPTRRLYRGDNNIVLGRRFQNKQKKHRKGDLYDVHDWLRNTGKGNLSSDKEDVACECIHKRRPSEAKSKNFGLVSVKETGSYNDPDASQITGHNNDSLLTHVERPVDRSNMINGHKKVFRRKRHIVGETIPLILIQGTVAQSLDTGNSVARDLYASRDHASQNWKRSRSVSISGGFTVSDSETEYGVNMTCRMNRAERRLHTLSSSKAQSVQTEEVVDTSSDINCEQGGNSGTMGITCINETGHPCEDSNRLNGKVKSYFPRERRVSDCCSVEKTHRQRVGVYNDMPLDDEDSGIDTHVSKYDTPRRRRKGLPSQQAIDESVEFEHVTGSCSPHSGKSSSALNGTNTSRIRQMHSMKNVKSVVANCDVKEADVRSGPSCLPYSGVSNSANRTITTSIKNNASTLSNNVIVNNSVSPCYTNNNNRVNMGKLTGNNITSHPIIPISRFPLNSKNNRRKISNKPNDNRIGSNAVLRAPANATQVDNHGYSVDGDNKAIYAHDKLLSSKGADVSFDIDLFNSMLDTNPFADIGNTKEPRLPGELNEDEDCTVFGAGLFYGFVGVTNNFQVWVRHTTNRGVSVSICGPKPNCVIETCTFYTGDNLYEVTYEVALPGYYVISVRYGDQNVADSPFIAKIAWD